jgi:hypothetical protein
MDAVWDVVWDYIVHHPRLTTAVVVIVLVLCYRWILWLFGVVIVPDNGIGMVT